MSDPFTPIATLGVTVLQPNVAAFLNPEVQELIIVGFIELRPFGELPQFFSVTSPTSKDPSERRNNNILVFWLVVHTTSSLKQVAV
jgi:hypothetical protein